MSFSATGRTGSHQACGWQALTREVIKYLSKRDDPPAALLWGSQAREFWTAALADAHTGPVFRTRHPSYDFARAFMAEGSHFEATAHLVDWWAIGKDGGRVL